MRCPACGTENEQGRKFCGECGGPLALACPQCGSPNSPGVKFCGECGTALAAAAAPRPAPVAEAPTAERRLVSVLFADLVGFTAASEARDAEDTRELLSRYFDGARTTIERYGGTVEKFIGDAVMAVWGTPVANEDDAERAVRAALDLVAAVPELDASLKARAGVLTGEAAVTIGAEGEGMVAGDLVNTASRIQSAAEPGTVLAGEATKRATEAAIAYEDAGRVELRGKAEPVPLFRAIRVTAGRAGALKSVGLEAPLVGRDRELRVVKDLFHASAEERRAHLVSVVGTAGVGKSRLGWEFFKYVDGLVEDVWWHRGRCLAYGEGVAYWALAEMVRMRAGIAEEEAAGPAIAQLVACIEEYVADPEERSWIEPRLAHLLGLADRQAPDREDLFSAWRLFFERIAERGPCVLVFEDLQWADPALLDFIAYQLDWSRNHPLFVVTFARPELAERHPGWSGAARNVTTLSLEPLPEGGMEGLLDGFVPGLPEELRTQILARAEGVPLYAVETVRMLLDRGLLAQEGAVYRPTGPIEALAVPETLHALIAARLDGLSAEERRLLQDASVLGKTFAAAAVAALTGLPEVELEPLLGGLVRKEVLGLQVDPRSPERGQYGFLQELVRRVAYETLSKRERKARHLAAASYFVESWSADEQEIVEVVASHYLEAYELAPEADDAAEIKAKAGETLTRAGERAASLAASAEAERYFAHAAELADDPLAEAALRERAGQTAFASGSRDVAESHFERAIALLEAASETHPAARVSARLGEVVWRQGRIEQALERMQRAFEVLAGDEPDADFALLAAQLGRLHYFKGELEPARERIETALDVAETLRLPEVLSEALNTKAMILLKSRPEESLALLRHALELALEHDLAGAVLRAYMNLSFVMAERERWEDAIGYLDRGIALARSRGDRSREWALVANLVDGLHYAGEWEAALARAAELPDDPDLAGNVLIPLVRIHTARGDMGESRRLLAVHAGDESSADVQKRGGYVGAQAVVLGAEGVYREALVAGQASLSLTLEFGNWSHGVEGFVESVEAAFALKDLAAVEEIFGEIDAVPRSSLPHLVQAQRARLGARLAERRGEGDRVEQGLKRAAALLRELSVPFWLGVALLEHGEWLAGQGRQDEAEPLLAEAREIFERLEARPWLERLARSYDAVTA